MDALTLFFGIAPIIGIILTFLLNLYQSVKSRHFESDCGICSCFYSSEHQENKQED